ncbi:heavy metal sensor histidine kinase [Psychrosphaera sp. 1_MG-2023]|uniref:heavy metal sensor histidine kinase n=1 Tax=Psychrosphaera sp. 1_MG-2023 TaxID=3062643 RepID=UPI0026E1B8D5|nr:heavy metal sensor histidine kinase [Psychrosphaera sp. 1_MG-2023]MDO6719178.1 heavy metal sensor histidine kinase [Psychrosphaera sp. 1_MG-2023]
MSPVKQSTPNNMTAPDGLKLHQPMSLTTRVVVFVALTIIACLSVVGTLINSSISHHFLQQDSVELKVIIHSVESSLSQKHQTNKQLVKSLSKAVAGHHGVFYQVKTPQNQLLYSNAEFDISDESVETASVFEFTAPTIVQLQHGDATYRAMLSEFENDGVRYRITAAIDMSFHMHFLTQFKQSLWVIMLGSSLLVILAAWFAIYQGLNPLRGLSQKMQKIQTNNKNVRLDVTQVPIELVNMVESFNLMLDRLQEEFIRLSNFSSDIAHELRTPLTNMVTQTQVGLSQSRDLEQYRELLFSNLEEVERLTKMVSDMLWLAKTQNGLIKPEPESLKSYAEIDALFDYFDAFAEEAQITFIKRGPEVTILCDKLQFRQLLSNLISNAIRHTPKGQQITVEVEKLNYGQVAISVINPGEKIAAEYLPFLFDRFYRPDKSRQRHSEGVGLGLAIAKAIAETNGGNINVTSTEQLTCFKVVLNTDELNP